MDSLINVKNLSYKYKNVDKYAIENINFSAKSGDIVAIIGKSGSGKTTLINSILKFFKNIEGSIEVSENIKQNQIDFCMQNQSVDWYLNVYDNIYLGYLYSDENDDKNIINKVIDILGLKEYKKRDLTELSGGQLQRVQIARSLVSNPKLIFLDEPTSGLDVISAKKVLDYLEKIKEKKIIFISSHDLDLVEKYCNKIIYLDEGKCIYFGEMKTFLKNYNKEISYSIDYDGELLEQTLLKIKNIVKVNSVNPLNITLNKFSDIYELLKIFVENNLEIISINKNENSLKKIIEMEG